MKIKEGFIIREVAGKKIVVAIGLEAKNFNGMITLNGTGAFLWEKATVNADKDYLVEELLKEYNVDKEIAKKDVSSFLAKLTEADLLK